MVQEKETDALSGRSLKMTRDEYLKMSEDRKVVTPENIGGLLEYPALFHAMQDDRELRPALSEAMSTGRAMADFLAMSPEEFMRTYVVADGPVNPKTGKPYGTDTKAYVEWRASQDKTPVSTEQMNMFGKMASAYNGHAFIQAMSSYDNWRNVVLSAKIHGVDCACLIDSLYSGPGAKPVVAVDVKTTSDLCGFGRSADSLHYREQQALIMLVLQANGVETPQTRIAAIEKGPMPRCGVFAVRNLYDAAAAVESTLRDYAEGTATGNYRTLFEAPEVI